MISVTQYSDLRAAIVRAGFNHEIEWAQSIRPVSDALPFWGEYSWVVLNSGMANPIARQIWEKVRPHVLSGGSAHDVFGHKGKAEAIDRVFRDRDKLLKEYLLVPEDGKIAWLRHLPWIGPITCWHLAKNYGFDVAKPDRHLVRIAGAEGVRPMCARLAEESGDRVATVDLVLWRAATLKLI